MSRDPRRDGPEHGPTDPARAHRDRHVFIDHDEGDWRWRRRIRANPTTRRVYRSVVFVVGLMLLLGGLALVPLPGPGWFTVILGLVIWASEFERAQTVLEFVKTRVRAWNHWVQDRSLPVRAALGLLGFAFLLALAWLTLLALGVPTFLPDAVEEPLVDLTHRFRSPGGQ